MLVSLTQLHWLSCQNQFSPAARLQLCPPRVCKFSILLVSYWFLRFFNDICKSAFLSTLLHASIHSEKTRWGWTLNWLWQPLWVGWWSLREVCLCWLSVCFRNILCPPTIRKMMFQKYVSWMTLWQRELMCLKDMLRSGSSCRRCWESSRFVPWCQCWWQSNENFFSICFNAGRHSCCR